MWGLKLFRLGSRSVNYGLHWGRLSDLPALRAPFGPKPAHTEPIKIVALQQDAGLSDYPPEDGDNGEVPEHLKCRVPRRSREAFSEAGSLHCGYGRTGAVAC